MKKHLPHHHPSDKHFFEKIFLIFFLLSFPFTGLLAQKPVDSLVYATDGDVLVTKIAGDKLYLGGKFDYIGKRTGSMAFFPQGSSLPDKNWPIFHDIGSVWKTDQNLMALPDGKGGWYVGGTFSKVNNREMTGLIHLLPDKTPDPDFKVNWYYFFSIKDMKKDNNFLYIAGNLTGKDANDSLHAFVLRINLETKKIDPAWNPMVEYKKQADHTKAFQSNTSIDRILIADDKVFLGGFPGKVQGVQVDGLAVVDKNTGKLLPFPTCSSNSAMDLAGDTLFIGQESLYWSSYTNGFGYIAPGAAVLTDENDSISPYQKENTSFYAATADGQGGWYALGRYQYTDGVFHLNHQLDTIAAFRQTVLNSFSPFNKIVLQNNSLYICRNGNPVNLDIGNGHTESFLFKLDPVTGDFDAGFQPQVKGPVYAMAFKGDTLFVGGSFDSIGGKKRNGLAAINAKTGALLPWTPEIHYDNHNAGYTGPDRVIRSLKIIQGKLYVAGKFQISTDSLYTGGKGIYGLARYDANTGIQDTTFHVWTSYYDNPLITGMASANGKLYLVGSFKLSTTSEGFISNAAWVDIANHTIHKINNDLEFTSQRYVYTYLPDLYIRNNKLYLWGMSVTDTMTGEKRENMVTLNLSTLKLDPWNPAPNTSVYTLSYSGGQTLLSGGFYFIHYNEGHFGGFNIRNKQFVHMTDVYSVKTMVHSGRYLYVGGDFTKYGDSVVNGLFRLKRSNLSFSPYHHHIQRGTGRASINCLALGNNGLYVTGISYNPLDNVGGVERHNICLLDAETAQLKTWMPPESDGIIYKVFAFGDDVFINGNFNLMPAWKRTQLARFDLKTGKPDSWAPIITGYYPKVYDLSMAGDTLYIAGTGISKVNTVDAGNLCALSTQSGSPLNGFTPPDFNDGVRLLYKTGKTLFAVSSDREIKRLDAGNGTASTWGTPLIGGKIYSLLADGPALYVGGKDLEVRGNGNKYPLLHLNFQNGSLMKSYGNYPVRAFVLGKNNNGKILAGVSWYNRKDSVSLYALDKKSDTLFPLNVRQGFSSGITHLQSLGSYFLAFGNEMIEHNQYTAKPGLFVYSPEDDTVITAFSTPLVVGDADDFATNEKTLVIGGAFGGMNGQLKNTDIAFMHSPKLMLQPGVSSWSPQKANTTNPFALTVFGSGFNGQTSVMLRSDTKSVTADSLHYSRRKVTAYFNGKDFTTGPWDLKVNINGSDSVLFTKAVTIEEGKFTDTWMHWIGPSKVLLGKPVNFYLTYGNRGNQDAYGVFLYVAVGKEQTVQFHRKLDYPQVKFEVNWDTIPHYVNVDHFLGDPFDGKVYTLFFPYLPPDFEDAIRLTVIARGSHEVRFAISKPIFKDYAQLAENMKSTDNAAYNFFNCMYAVADAAADLTPGLGCAKAAFDNIVMSGIDHYVKNQSVQTEDVANAVGMIALGCIPGGTELRTAFAVAKGMAGVYGAGSGIASACGPFVDDMGRGWNDLVAYVSHDPNAKYGPSGRNSSRYVPSRHPYNYMVTFENDSTATAPAERVIITDTLDTSVFDIHTFKALGFGFGDTSYVYKPQDGDTVDMDMRPEKPYIVRVFHHLNTATGILTWYFQTLDPDTYELVENVSDGFLPPNKKAPEGEGNILYSITPIQGLSEGTEIKNTAHIVFDWNKEIPTGTWQNITDNTPPESAVKPLPEVSMTKDFTVKWDGTDKGDGIFSYTVYVSENDSAYYPWILDTHDTTAVFSGEGGITYKFYSVATDSAGNKEEAPALYDAVTRVSGTGITQFGSGNKMQLKIYPNPAGDRLHVETYLPANSFIDLTIINLCGHPVMHTEFSDARPGVRKTPLDVSHLPAGVYFVRLQTRYGIQIRKVVVR